MSDVSGILLQDMDFSAFYDESEVMANVLPASDYLDALKESIRARHRENRVFLPWEKTRDHFEFRKGEVSVWAGQNGHGKSQTTDMVKLSLIGQGQKVASASFEMKPVTNLRRMARMYMGTNPFSEEYNNEAGRACIDELFEEFCGWVHGKLWIYNQSGQTSGRKVVGYVRYCAKELGCDHIFVDNLAKCVRNEDDYNEQKSFVERMCAIALDENIHIHIVHHLKKPDGGEGSKPEKGDVKGSGAITDQPDNLFLVWRNKPKEESRKSGKMDKESEPDSVVFCRKQRNYEGNGDNEPTIALWYHGDSLQYVAHQSDGALFFPNYPHYPT